MAHKVEMLSKRGHFWSRTSLGSPPPLPEQLYHFIPALPGLPGRQGSYLPSEGLTAPRSASGVP